MPIDPSIYANIRPVAPIQTPSPLDLIGTVERVQGLREQTELRRLAGEKARQAAADDAAVRRALTASGGDPDAALTQLWQEAPGPAAALQKHLEETRKARMDAMKTGLDNQQKQADLALQIARTVGDDGAGYGLARPAMVATSPVLDTILPPADAPWNPARWSQIMQAGVSGKDLLEHKQKVVDLFAQGKVNEAVGTALSALKPDDPTAGTQAKSYLDGAKALGAPETVLAPYRALFTPDGAWAPDASARAAQLAITPKERETLEGQAATRAQTEAHQTVQEGISQGQLDLGRTREAREAAQAAARLKLDEGQGLGALTPEALALTAHQYAMTGQLPPMGMGKAAAAARTAIINKAADTYKNLDLPTQIAAYKANQASLTKLQGTADKVQAFESTAGKNLDQFLALAEKIPDTGIPWLNQPVRAVSAAMLGSTNQAAFNAARDVALREIARVTSDPNLSGVLSDSARREVQALSPETATFAQIKAVAKVLKQDMANVRAGLGTQIGDIQQRIATPPGGAPSAAPAAPPSPAGGAALTYQDYLRSKGGR